MQSRLKPSNNWPPSRLAIIRGDDVLATGDRHRLIFSAAANLAEFGCPAMLAHALLTVAGLHRGQPPKDVHRQIEYGPMQRRKN